ncbi:C40 family peptidase [Streptomyces boluensis]|uniref:Hydrolase n=1 Tax=Streptomyces boluensis TaxID=1775135 RepID=A0A964US63_9ACTN|nr:C40 family peptidase [Streptomyces boluensis]NBE53787.1 hydrolase [Streptomyces boluensis]
MNGSGALLAQLPDRFWSVPYRGARFPGAAVVGERPGLELGANCQLFAYAVLAHFGLTVPPLRSSELWHDTADTVRVPEPGPLDLVLFSGDGDPYGAHVGVWLGDDTVLHLCVEVGRPVVWARAAFAERAPYRVFLGAKRVVRGSP